MYLFCCFFFKQKTAYEMRISDWSSDVCSSDLGAELFDRRAIDRARQRPQYPAVAIDEHGDVERDRVAAGRIARRAAAARADLAVDEAAHRRRQGRRLEIGERCSHLPRSEKHTASFQLLMRTPYAVFCLK